jgi:23S rRNA (cytidine1920-2'-O)/16S rRNA (cytidine1409-2'-O)-methyltransferase
MLRRGLVDSRSEAQHAIEEGRVRVGGVAIPKAASMIEPGTPIDIRSGGSDRFVSRGGLKLEAALEAFGIDPSGRHCLDAGASTGGFTDCLLQKGAATVCAVDVGYGQLAWTVRQDERVDVHDRTNVRHSSSAELGGPFDLVVADLSFISLCKVGPALAELSSADSDLVLLVKPQFELGKEEVGKGGIVREAEGHNRAIRDVVECLIKVGLGTVAVTSSPIRGAKGNREFFVHVRHGPVEVADNHIEETTQS